MNIEESREKWLAVLKDKDSKKTTGKLAEVEIDNHRCCLGHACHAMNIESIHICCPDTRLPFLEYWGEKFVLPDSIARKLNIKQDGGFLKAITAHELSVLLKREVCIEGDQEVTSLVKLNDATDLEPFEIAKYLEKNFDNLRPWSD